MSKFLSGTLRKLLVGISGYTENKTVIQTTGKVGIGTTDAQQHSLFVVGSTNITGDTIVGGGLTAVGIGSFQSDVYIDNQLFVGGVNITGGASVGEDITTRNLKATGISTFVGITTVESTLFTNQLSVAGVSTFQSNVHLGDDDRLRLGDSNELQIYHNSTNNHSIISENGGGDLRISADRLVVLNPAATETVAIFDPDGAVELYYDNSKKFETTGAGVTVTGTAFSNQLNVSGVSTFNGNVDANGDLDVDGRTELDITNISETLNVVGISTFSSDVDINASIDIDGHTELDNVNISGVTTFADAIDANGDLDVDGHTDLDNVSISGVTTTTGLLDANGGLTANEATVEDLTNNRIVIAGVGGRLEDSANLTFDGVTLDVVGQTEVDRLNVSGIATFAGNIDANGDLDVDGQTELDNVNVSGIATIQNLDVQGDFDVYDTEAVFHNNVYIAGNLGIGGTATVITAQDLQVFDRDIILGITTDSNGEDISNDTTANHGGVAVASTVGSPLVDLTLEGFSDLLPTYKQIMWVAANSYGVGTTDAWHFNYAVGIGSTLVPNGTRFAVKEIQVTDNTIKTPNLNVTGVGTIAVLHAPSITPDGTDFGTSGYFPKADGSGGWEWADVPGLFSVNNILNGFNVSEEGSIVGTAGSITQIDFRGANIVATADPQPNGIATITMSDTPTFDELTVSGTTQTQQLNVTGVSTFQGAAGFGGNVTVTGISTFVGVGTFNGDLYVGGDLYVADDLVFDSFTAREINVTERSNLHDLYVAGVSTFVGFATAQDTLFANQLNVSGVSTFYDRVIFDSTNSIQIPVGTEGEKDAVGVAVTGQIRFNTTNQQFEGFGVGNNWGSLGGVKDVDGDTYILAETTAGSDEDTLYFYTGGNLSGILSTAGADFNVDLNVDGHTELDNLNVSGVSTFSDDVNIGTGGTTAFFNVGTGKVGINATTPLATLSVGDKSLSDVNVPVQISTQSATSQIYYGANNNGGYGLLFGYDNNTFDGVVIRSVGASDKIDFAVNNTTRALTIAANGNIGVNKTSPTSGLDVVGTVNVSGVSTFNGTTEVKNSSFKVTNSSVSGQYLEIIQNGDSSLNLNKVGAGAFYIEGNNIYLGDDDSTQTYAGFERNGKSYLNYNGITRLETTGYGITVYDTIQAPQLNISGIASVGSAITMYGATGIISATAFYGDGANLANTGSTLSPASGVQRVVLTDLTSGTMVTSSTDGDLTYDATHDILNVQNVNVAAAATFGGTISAGGTVGTSGQYLQSTGVGVTWANFPSLRTTQANVATDNQTAFVFTYNVNFLDVFVNGVKLATNEYTATNGTDITLTSPAFGGDIVEFHSYNTAALGSSGSATVLNDLTDVTISPLSDNQILQYNSSSGLWENVSFSSVSSTKSVGTYTATSSQTTFGATYDVGYVDVYLNGSKLSEDQYTATNGTSVVLDTGATAGDIVEIVGFKGTTGGFAQKSVSRHTATSSQTSFSATYDVGYVDVYLNGVKLSEDQYTATDGASIVLDTGATAGDVLEIVGLRATPTGGGGGGTTIVGAGGTWATDAVGINTVKSVGIGTEAQSGYKLYVEGDARVTGILTVGPASVTIDGINNEVTVGTGITLYGNTGIISATSLNVTGALSGDASSLTGLTGASAATYGNGSAVPQITVDANGRITGISNVLISGGGGGGSSIIIKDDNSLVGTAGTINFGTGLTVSSVVDSAVTITVNGSELTSLNATQLTSGTVPDARFPATLPSASGVNLTSLNASNLGSGTIPDARFPATLPSASGANLTSLNASNLGSGTIPDARFPATLPAVSGANLTNITPAYVSAWTLTGNGSEYFFSGSGFDGTETNPDLYLVRGQKYRFNASGSHPFQIQSTFGAGGTVYNDGVTNNNSAAVDFNVQNDAPDVLFYQCTNHSGMRGKIIILGDRTIQGSWTAAAGVLENIDTITGISSINIKSAEYTLHIEHSSGMQAQKVLTMQTGSTAYSQEFAIMYDNSLLVSVGSSVHNGNFYLNATPETGITGITTYRFTRQTMR